MEQVIVLCVTAIKVIMITMFTPDDIGHRVQPVVVQAIAKYVMEEANYKIKKTINFNIIISLSKINPLFFRGMRIFSYFDFVEGTPIWKNPNKFGSSLIFSYLCTRFAEGTHKSSRISLCF